METYICKSPILFSARITMCIMRNYYSFLIKGEETMMTRERVEKSSRQNVGLY